MSHTWKAEVWHTDETNYLRFADGDDVTVTRYIGLAKPPEVTLERNSPLKCVLTINNMWSSNSMNVLHSSFRQWSSGTLSAAVAEGMYIRAFHRDSISGTETRDFQGRIKRIDEASDGTISLTAYDETMVLGETKDPYIVFQNARDRIGDALFASGPDIDCAFNSDEQIEATLPDAHIVTPLMKLMLAEPLNMEEVFTATTSSHNPNTGLAQVYRVTDPNFYKIRFRYCNNMTTFTATAHIWTVDANDLPDTLVASSASFNLPNTGSSTSDFIEIDSPPFPTKLTPGTKYAFGIIYGGTADGVYVRVAHQYLGSNPPFGNMVQADDYYETGPYSGWIESTQSVSYELVPVTLQEREISSENYLLTEGASTTALVIDQGSTSITPADMTAYGHFLRATYYYGTRTVAQAMIDIAARGGFTASLISGVTATDGLGFYNTGTYSYLECLKELADLYDSENERQWAFAAYIGGDLDDKILRIGTRRQPWNDSVDSYIFSDYELDGESSTVYKRMAQHALKRYFEAKVGTQRIIGKAFDGSPIFIETDDRLWSSLGSLILRTGSPLMDISMDNTITSAAQLALTAEAAIREQHQNHVEGTVPLNGFFPSLWDFSTSDQGFGQSKIFGLTIPKFNLSGFPAIASQMVLQGKQTLLTLDNTRPADTSIVNRNMNKAKMSESFNVASLPDTVYIPARYASDLTGYAAYDRIRLRRSDGTYFYTTNLGTRVVVTHDHCGPNGIGYVHAGGFFPGGVEGSLSSYAYAGGTPHNYAIDRVAWGDGSNWTEVTLPQTYFAWAHQNVLVDFRAPDAGAGSPPPPPPPPGGTAWDALEFVGTVYNPNGSGNTLEEGATIADIRTALAACPNGQCVMLGPGDYYMNDNNPLTIPAYKFLAGRTDGSGGLATVIHQGSSGGTNGANRIASSILVSSNSILKCVELHGIMVRGNSNPNNFLCEDVEANGTAVWDWGVEHLFWFNYTSATCSGGTFRRCYAYDAMHYGHLTYAENHGLHASNFLYDHCIAERCGIMDGVVRGSGASYACGFDFFEGANIAPGGRIVSLTVTDCIGNGNLCDGFHVEDQEIVDSATFDHCRADNNGQWSNYGHPTVWWGGGFRIGSYDIAGTSITNCRGAGNYGFPDQGLTGRQILQIDILAHLYTENNLPPQGYPNWNGTGSGPRD